MGRATATRLVSDGARVIGVDVHDADVVADLSTELGRSRAVEKVRERARGAIDGIVTWAGVAGLSDLSGSLVVSVNYFGSVVLLDALRPLLAAGVEPAAVVVSSNSTTAQPGIPMQLVEQCLSGDEATARKTGDEVGALAAYPAAKIAVAWWARRNAPTEPWAGSGIGLNVIVPGAVETPMLEATRRDPTIGRFIDSFPIPVGRPGRPEELAEVVSFLLGPASRFCCGSVIFCDGGTDALLNPQGSPTPP
jgi:NAD(P)-dependent dehydrogenase (short-subunit alcohol dehydrogenase family)